MSDLDKELERIIKGCDYSNNGIDPIDDPITAIKQAFEKHVIGEDEILQVQSDYDKVDVPHKETDRSVDGSMLYTVRQASRNGYRNTQRQSLWSDTR